jgi:hypothetical protein
MAWKEWSGAALAAFVASLCCIGPSLAVGLGISVFPLGGWIPVVEKWRPLFLGLAAFLLFIGYQKVFGNPRCACEPKRLFQKRPIFIGVALIVAFLMTYPYISVWIRG